MKIVVDAMGGDNAPAEIVKGALMAAKLYPETEIVLVGREDAIKSEMEKNGYTGSNITVVHASEVVGMHDDPATVLRHKKDSSMAVALTMLRKGDGDAIVSAGSTGALLSGATLFAKRIPGIRRGALGAIIPAKNGGVLLLDSGANTECTAEYLLQFGFMGSLYMQKMMGMKNPRIGLLNIGSEDSKGGPLQKEAYILLKEAGDHGRLNFVGNIEARDVPQGACDVLVCDGFTGNVLLKSIEGVGLYMAEAVKGIFMENMKTKLAYLMVHSGMQGFKKMMSYEEVGGAPFMGISKAVIKAHGSSNALSIQNAIRQAITYAQSGMIEEITKNIPYMTTENQENTK